MENNANYFSDLKKAAEAYIQDKLLLLKLKAARQIAGFSAILIVAAVFIFFLFFFFLFLGITIAFVLGSWLNSMIAAYAIVFVFYLLVLFMIVLNRKNFGKRFLKATIKIAFPKQKQKP